MNITSNIYFAITILTLDFLRTRLVLLSLPKMPNTFSIKR